MAFFSWIEAERQLSSAALTVRAQTVSPNDEGRLFWDLYFPRENTDSVRLSTISTVDFRPVGDRREWNATGRLIGFISPSTAEFEMVPIETYFNVDEAELQHLMETVAGNASLLQGLIGVQIPDRVDRLVAANYRRIEVDAMTAWSLGQITARNPTTGATVTTSLGFDATRYKTGGVTAGYAAWTNVNAYGELIRFLTDSVDLMGGYDGVVLRQSSYNLVQASAPRPAAFPNYAITRAQLLDQIQQDIGQGFRFHIREDSMDVHTGAGLTTARTKVWPAKTVAAIPSGTRVGSTYFAPVFRAYEFAGQDAAEIDVRGVSVFRNVSNEGRHLNIQAQVNAAGIPVEQNVHVLNTAEA
jgi:hypothetical protein